MQMQTSKRKINKSNISLHTFDNRIITIKIKKYYTFTEIQLNTMWGGGREDKKEQEEFKVYPSLVAALGNKGLIYPKAMTIMYEIRRLE